MPLIDPPSGWKYGFPKPYLNPDNLPLAEWLVANGYPQRELDLFPAATEFCRYIETEEEAASGNRSS